MNIGVRFAGSIQIFQRLIVIGGQKPAERPDRHRPHQRGAVLQQQFGRRDKGDIGAVTDCDQDIPHEPVTPEPFYRRARKHLAKIFIIERREIP